MMKCKICGQPTEHRTDLYCPPHALEVLTKLDDSGYLQPLKVQTIDGLQKLSNRRFLSWPKTPQTFELPPS